MRDKPLQVTNTARVAQDIGIPGFAAMFMGPGLIEEQEALGQIEAVASESIPTPDTETRPQYEALGFVFGEPFEDDKLFSPVTMPAGWAKKPTSHSMHVDIVDGLGNVRGSFFYKAAYYDRQARLGAAYRRYNVEEHSLDARDTYERCNLVRFRVLDRVVAQPIKDALNKASERRYAAKGTADEAKFDAEIADLQAKLSATALFETEQTVGLPRPKDDTRGDEEATKAHRAWWNRHEALRAQVVEECKVWLSDRFADHENVAAYWPA
jgi:hypothetical protein